MRNIFRSVGEVILVIFQTIYEFIGDFRRKASDRCKIYTLIAFLLVIFFAGIDMYESHLNKKAEREINETADTVFDPIITLIDDMDGQSQEILSPVKNAFIEIKPIWIKLALFIAAAIIGYIISLIKKPADYLKNVIYEDIEEIHDEPMMWIPFVILVLLDITQLVSDFV